MAEFLSSFLEARNLHPIVSLHCCLHFLLAFHIKFDLYLVRLVFLRHAEGEALRQLECLLLLEHHDELFLGKGCQVEGLGFRFGHDRLLGLHLRTLSLGDLLGLLAASLIDLLTRLFSSEIRAEIAKKLLHLIWLFLINVICLLCDHILLALELLLHVGQSLQFTVCFKLGCRSSP